MIAVGGVVISCGTGVGEFMINIKVGVMVGVSVGTRVGEGVTEGVNVAVKNFAVCVAAAAAVWAMMALISF